MVPQHQRFADRLTRLEETKKFVAEAHKLEAERRKLDCERAWFPWLRLLTLS